MNSIQVKHRDDVTQRNLEEAAADALPGEAREAVRNFFGSADDMHVGAFRKSEGVWHLNVWGFIPSKGCKIAVTITECGDQWFPEYEVVVLRKRFGITRKVSLRSTADLRDFCDETPAIYPL